ncbi:chromosomal replication initiator protein DnaA [Aquiluna borgnonia]|uniref:Chromosomal replication initiator protein DnaA n=1 Tax=Aquiluna borgnonia TaxID=2499157 RepID=A0A7D4U6Z4_9MICO|nr:chromosomal replication initiator protein DnaA [Aquiluna borgnonia]QKJ24636.1 chromosomal replication initiator protein DnaA [Aquiluna borgnonia]
MADEQLNSLWQSLVSQVTQDDRVTPHLRGHLELATPKGVLGDTLYIEVPNDITRSMLQQRLRAQLLDAMAALSEMGGPSSFVVITNEDLQSQDKIEFVVEPEPKLPDRDPATGPVKTTGESRLNPKYSFENFVTGGSNRFAHAAAFAVSEAPAEAYNPLFIYGSSGLGKTHLLHAIGHYAIHLKPKTKVRYVSSEEFTNDFINAIQNNKNAEFQAQYRDVDILLVDDIQFLSGKDQTQEAFFHTFNTLHDHNKQVVITSDLRPKQLAGFEERMLSRFEWGLTTDIQAPEFETRVAILRKKAAQERISVPDNVIEFMAARISSNIRELEGTLIRVTAFANLNRQSIDMDLVQLVMKDSYSSGDGATISPLSIITATANYYKISPDDITGSGRQQAVALARQIAMHICRELTDMSLPKIGTHFGNRDHTTVMYATKKISTQMREKRYIYNQVSEIIQKIKDENK